jgi:hypothetical protein
MFNVNTQFACDRVSDTPKKHWHFRILACNVKRCNKPVASDTVFSDSQAVHSGVTASQEQGVMDRLIKYCAKAENSNRIKQILCALYTSSWLGEPYHENQNYAENQYVSLKTATNHVINFSGAPAKTWLLALIYVCI